MRRSASSPLRAAANTRGNTIIPLASSLISLNFGRSTRPARITSAQFSWRKRLKVFPASPMETLALGKLEDQLSAAPPKEITNTARPAALALCATACGSSPPPAIMPSLVIIAIRHRYAQTRSTDGPLGRRQNEFHHFLDF